MATYKTPGVYVKEISTLPASIAQVETAIPVFIGYTQTALKQGEGVENKAVRISSLVDYQEIYGEGPPLTVTSVKLNNDNSFDTATISSKYILYDSLRMFFLNGGGECYIVSIGSYSDTPSDRTPYSDALNGLQKEDEPTLILFPDATKLLDSTQFGELQQEALVHCAKMQDRFAVLDVLDGGSTTTVKEDQDAFRASFGMQDMKYGAAYYPWLKSSLSLDVAYRDIKGTITKGGVTVKASDLIDDTTSSDTADQLDLVVESNIRIEDEVATLATGSIRDEFESAVTALKAEINNAGPRTKLQELMSFLFSMVEAVDHWTDDNTSPASMITDAGAAPDHFMGSAQDYVFNSYKSTVQTLLDYDAEAVVDVIVGGSTYASQAPTLNSTHLTGMTGVASAIFDGSGGTNAEVIAPGIDALEVAFEQIYAGMLGLQTIGETFEGSLEMTVLDEIPAVRNAMRGVSGTLTTLPPSGAVVGVYARVDRNRGVWKAPANESLSAVKGVTKQVTFDEQENLNVDATSGKSINAIRTFTGRGILIWGARTLAGNDNEWRYVPVRRLYITIEESIKKATEFVVFEPNDANTWVRVKGMIKNYLTELWKQGALAGAKPDHAFFVNVGLGETMTAQDILEGRMIVEIGLAAVRPAEFIILKFSHKLQES